MAAEHTSTLVGLVLVLAMCYYLKPSMQQVITGQPQAADTRSDTQQESQPVVLYANPPQYGALRYNTEPTQLGTLTGNVNGTTSVLPLMGYVSPTRSSRWHYYTYTDSINRQPLPVRFEGRDCMQNIGCNEIMQGDSVGVVPYNSTFDTYLFQ